VADDSEIWRKYQSNIAQITRSTADFPALKHCIQRKDRKDAEAAKKNVLSGALRIRLEAGRIRH
jgi:hypothetical protein